MEITDPAESISADASRDSTLPPLTLFDQVNLNAFWIANLFHWQALLAVVIPSMVAHFLDPRYKAINLSTVVTLGTIVAFIVNPLAGAISDHIHSRMGLTMAISKATMIAASMPVGSFTSFSQAR